MKTEERIYTGVGARSTPPEILNLMRKLGKRLAELGHTLRSGAASGADTAFEEGCMAANGRAEIYVPWRTFQLPGVIPAARILPTPQEFEPAFELIAAHHPAWTRLKDSVRRLHGRNAMECLGLRLDSPSNFGICWTPDGCTGAATRTAKTGGTATAIVLCEHLGIPMVNLANPGWQERLRALALSG